MPSYEFRCNDTGKRFIVSYKTYAEYNPARVSSPFTGTKNVARIIRPVGLAKSESTRWDRLEANDPQALAELEDADPRTLGRALRHLSEVGDQSLVGEFNEVIERLETGQSPEDIERAMPGIDTYDSSAPAPDGHED